MSPFPDSYPSTVDLPFNAACLAGRFFPQPPDAQKDGDGYWLLLAGGELLVQESSAGLTLPRGTVLPEGIVTGAAPLHFGTWDGLPCRVAPVARELPLPAGWARESLLSAAPRLSIAQLSLGALAGQLLHWEKSSRHCAACGATLAHLPGEWGKSCTVCRAQRYPAIHPCVIVLIHRPGEVLLARKPEWPAGRYGLVAGFVDFGEALEEAVVREVREETGVSVGEVRYVGSQAWPFPSQLMTGFTAVYAGGELHVDGAELEDARWFPLDALPELPPKRSIARFLLDRHLRADG